MRRSIVLALFALGLSACGSSEPTYDDTNEATRKASSARMMKGLSEIEQLEFNQSSAKLLFDPLYTRDANGEEQMVPDTKAKLAEITKSLHGLTVKQINAKAQAARESAASRKPAS